MTKNKSLNLIAKTISYLFIPPVMNFVIFLIYSLIFENSYNTFYSILISFLFGLLIPVITILKFKKDGRISDYDASIKDERTIPYIYAIFYSLIGVLLSGLLQLSPKIIMLWMVYLINSIFIININHWWKISAHAMGASMPLGALSIINNIEWVLVSIIVLIIIGFARIYLRVHTPMQVISGAIFGFTVAFILLNYTL